MQNLQVTLLPKPAFDDIINSKNNPTKAMLLSLQGAIKTRFDEYRLNKLKLENLIGSLYPNGTDNHRYLISCYDSETVNRNKIIANIKSNQLDNIKGTCQYCCLGESNTIDHYLPKNIFPEFSVFTLNLIPCCSKCNSSKGELIKDESGIREIINFYFDIFLTSRFLFCSVTISNNIPIVNFYIKNISNLSLNDYKIVENHFSNLKLFERYKDKINGEISEIENTCKSIVLNDSDKGKIKDILFDISKRNKKTFGINYWKAVLMEGLANCQDFIDLL